MDEPPFSYGVIYSNMAWQI